MGSPSDDLSATWRLQKTKSQLLAEARRIYPPPTYKIQKIANKFDVKVLFLPVGHSELNPIEIVWVFVKRKVAMPNMNFSLTEVENLTRLQLSSVTSDCFKKYYEHATLEENKYRDMNNIDSYIEF